MTDLEDFSEFDTDDEPDETPDHSDSTTETAGFDSYDVTPQGEDTGIGVLSAGDGLQISEEEDNTRLRAYVTADNRSSIRLGAYLLASYPDGEQLFSRITDLEYEQAYRADDATEIHARRAMRSAGIDEEDFKLMATLDPVAVLYEEDGALKRRMTDRVPKPETVVRQARDKHAIKTGLKIPSEGVFFGHLSVGGQKVQTAAEPPTIDYRLKDNYDEGDPLVFRHTLVAGGTGSGKTHGAKNILRQYLDSDRTYPVDESGGRSVQPAIVQFDPQDEYAQMHDDGDYDEEFTHTLERENIAYGGHDDTIAFVPKVGDATYAASHHRAEQVEFTIPFSMVYENPWLVAGSGLNENQYSALVNVLLPRFRRSSVPDTYKEFVSFIDNQALKEELDETGKVHEATFEAVFRRIRGFGSVFDQDAHSITDRIHEFVRPGGLTVVPTYHISESRYAETVILALASLLVDQKLSNDPMYDRIKETPLIVGMDEAHNFLTDADTVQAQRVIGKFTEAAKQGRKERLGLFLITQDPQDIADPVFKQINTTVVLNLGDEDAISAVNIPRELESKVPYMEKGQMVVYSPDNSEPVELIGLPVCVTKHGRE
jgi:DNA helicase HerA-like ATPase